MVTLGSADLGLAVNSLVHGVHYGESRRLPRMDDLRTWADVRNALERLGKGGQARLAEFLPINPSQLSRQLRKGEGELTVHQAEKTRVFLEAGGAVHNEDVNDTGQRPQVRDAKPSRTRLPVYGYAAAADGDLFVLNEGSVIEEMDLPMGVAVGPGDYFIVIPSGSSMEPRIIAGEPQVVRRGYPASRDKVVVVEFNDGTAVIKSYKQFKDGKLWVEQFNPPKLLNYDATSVRAIHPVIFSF
jgi:phage repressor protein C with HTH and peptisase S24 domain